MPSTRVRWTCPVNAHPGVLGPSRPRKDDLCRYCIPCSTKKGRLVERISPALQRQRAAAADAKKAAAERKKAKNDRQVSRYYDVNGLNALDYVRKMATLSAFSKVPGRELVVEMHRVGPNHRLHGKARYGAIDLYVKADCTEATLRHTILHELAHVQVRRARKLGEAADRPHGKKFQAVLKRAIAQAERKFGPAAGAVPYLVGDGKKAHAAYEKGAAAATPSNSTVSLG